MIADLRGLVVMLPLDFRLYMDVVLELRWLHVIS